MKKIAITLSILLIIISLVWILFKTVDRTSSPSKKEPAEENKIVHLKFGHNTPVDSALHEAALRFAEGVKRKTDAKVIIDVFPAQKLGNDHQMVEMAREGKIDILLTPTAKMSVAVPSVQYADLPFYFPTREDVYEMLDGEPGDMILHDLKSIGLLGISFWENGFKHFTANEPLLRVEDFKEKKMRVMKSRIIMEQFRSFGAEPVAIDFHSTRKALHDRVVDGQENPLIAIVSMEFYKEQSDLTLSEHAYLGYILSFSQKSFNRLPQNIQMILVETAKEVTPWERAETQRREVKLLETVKNAGVKIHKISEKERQRFAQKVAHIPAKFEEIIGADVISKTKELLYEKYGAHLDSGEHILIGIDTDLSADSKVAGLAIKRGVETAVAEINAHGGILGRHIEVVAKDHRALASRGVENIKEFSKYSNLVAILGGVHGAVISAEMQDIQKFHIPYIIPWSASAGLVKNSYEPNYIFRVSANDNLAAKFIAEYAAKSHKRPALIVENSIWGRNNLKIMKEYFKKNNIDVATEIVYNRGQSSFVKEMSLINNIHADSLIMVANPMEGAKILHALSKKQKDIAVISHWGITSGDFFKQNKKIIKELDLSIFQTFSLNAQLNEKAKKLLKSYKERYFTNENIEASAGVAQAYDSVYLLAQAIEQAGTTEREDIQKALENLKEYQGVVKNYAPPFTKDRHEALDRSNFYMAKYNSKGTLIPVQKR